MTSPAQRLKQVVPDELDVLLEARTPRAATGRSTRRAVANAPDRSHLLHTVGRLARQVDQVLSAGADTPTEVARMARVFGRIEQILVLNDAPVLERLPPQVRSRLEHNLFAPLEELRQQLASALKSVKRALRPSESLALSTTSRPSRPDGSLAIRAAGDVETRGIETFETATVRGAAFTHKGIGYADYDEDALSIRVLRAEGDRPERIIAVVADQAGGEDKLSKSGAASKAAVIAWEQAVAEGVPVGAALDRADAAVKKLNSAEGKQALTTLSGVVLEGLEAAHTASAGDTQVLLYSRDGKLKRRTRIDNYGEELAERGRPNAGLRYASQITNVLGDEAGVTAHTARWGKLEEGDWLVLVSDGVGDMNLQAQQKAHDAGAGWTEWHLATTQRKIGELLASARTPEEAARSVLTQVFANVRSGDGKPDNTTFIALQLKASGAA